MILQVELNARDAALGACDLEVHVAVVVFVTDDVSQQDVLACGFIVNETDRDATDGVADRHTGVHQAEGRPTDRSHRARTV